MSQKKKKNELHKTPNLSDLEVLTEDSSSVLQDVEKSNPNERPREST